MQRSGDFSQRSVRARLTSAEEFVQQVVAIPTVLSRLVTAIATVVDVVLAFLAREAQATVVSLHVNVIHRKETEGSKLYCWQLKLSRGHSIQGTNLVCG